VLALLAACASDTPLQADTAPLPRWTVTEEETGLASADATPLPDEVSDVPIIIGGGPAGLALAGELGRALVLEADAVVGGRARWAGGFLFLVGTPEQAAAGIADDEAVALADWEALTGAQPTDATRAFLAANADVRARVVDLGIPLSLGRTDPVTGRIREHSPAGGGQGLVDALVGALGEEVELRVSTPVRGLVLRDGRAAGVYTDHGWIAADNVIIATGGFVDRADLVELHSGWAAGEWRLGDPTLANGDALDWAESAGLGTASLGAIGAYRDLLGFAGPDGQALQVNTGGAPPWIWVDADGARFVNESATWSVTLSRLAGARSNVWAITTLEAVTGAVSPEGRPFLVEGEAFHCAADLASLADTLGVDPAGLEATVLSVGTYAERLALDPLGRPGPTFAPLFGTPCAFRPGYVAAKNFGGLSVDADGRALDTSGAVIPGLWAVGEAAGMGSPGLGGTWGFDGSLAAVLWSGWRTGAAIAEEQAASGG
jgi:succinate dehydrogenase/fumarate reductase flavoprotein subunit